MPVLLIVVVGLMVMVVSLAIAAIRIVIATTLVTVATLGVILLVPVQVWQGLSDLPLVAYLIAENMNVPVLAFIAISIVLSVCVAPQPKLMESLKAYVDGVLAGSDHASNTFFAANSIERSVSVYNSFKKR